MSSVTDRINQIKQPFGGYISKKQMNIVKLEDKYNLNVVENIHPSLIGTTVDYLSRFLNGTDKKLAFRISILGAMTIDIERTKGKLNLNSPLDRCEEYKALDILNKVKGLDNNSIINACKLTGYDVCYRVDLLRYKPVDEINPDKSTIENIYIMVNRMIEFFKKYGPIVKDGFTFKNGYTNLITSGDGDFLTENELWEIKVIKREITSKHTLQLLIYYIMGLHSDDKQLFEKIKKLGIYNPRLNKIYTIDVDQIPKEVIKEVETNVIGYN